MEGYQHQRQLLNYHIYQGNRNCGTEIEYPPGYRFEPTDQELVHCYLKVLLSGHKLPSNHIPQIRLYDFSPHQLTANYKEHSEGTWYFFTRRNRKYLNGSRPARAADNNNGYWKQTNVVHEIMAPKPKGMVDRNGKRVVMGYKITLDYYQKGNDSKGIRSNWKMNEYRINKNNQLLDESEWVVCRIYKSSRARKNKGGGSKEHNELVVQQTSTPPSFNDEYSLNHNNANLMFNYTTSPIYGMNCSDIVQYEEKLSSYFYDNAGPSSVQLIRSLPSTEFTRPPSSSSFNHNSSSIAVHVTPGNTGMEIGPSSSLPAYDQFSPAEDFQVFF